MKLRLKKHPKLKLNPKRRRAKPRCR
jgi:hypothetical protein